MPSKPTGPGTTDDRPRWEGPPETRPRGYLPALDDPETDRDANGENLSDPDRSDADDFGKVRGDTDDDEGRTPPTRKP